MELFARIRVLGARSETVALITRQPMRSAAVDMVPQTDMMLKRELDPESLKFKALRAAQVDS